MSTRKRSIADKMQSLSLGAFTGVKSKGVYIVGLLSFKNLNEIETYRGNATEAVTRGRVAGECSTISKLVF